MRGFIELGSEYVNTDLIARIRDGDDGISVIVFKDGTERTIPGLCLDLVKPCSNVNQVIPASRPLFGMFANGSIYNIITKRIDYLALTESGDIRPLMLMKDGHFDFVDNLDDYMGLSEGTC